MSDLDVILKKYAEKCETIYENRTAGDHTWEGVLSSFLRELHEEDIINYD